MLFLARSAVCIGLVAAAASGVGTGSLATALDRGARGVADGAGRACLASSGCLRIGAAALATAALPAAGAPVGAAADPGPRTGGRALRAARQPAPPRG